MISIGEHIVKGQKSNYRIVDIIDAGTSTSLYVGLEQEYNEQVVVQTLPAEVDHGGTFVIRFQQEARRINSIKSELVPDVIDWGKDADFLYIILESISGKSLEKYLKDQSNNYIEDALLLSIAEQIASAFTLTHSLNIVHQDLNPGNIYINRDEKIRIINFGISPHINRTSISGGDAQANLAYMAPEYFRPDLEKDIRADIYALGVILYELATGKLPYRGGNLVQIINSIQVEEPEPISTYRFDLSKKATALIDKCLEKDPAKRFQNPQAILNFFQGEDVEDAIEDADIVDDIYASSVLMLDRIIEDFPKDDRTEEIRKEVLEGHFENKSGWIFQLLSKAQSAVNDEEWELARQLIETVLSFQPENPHALRLLDRLPSNEFRRASLTHADGTKIVVDKTLIAIGRHRERDVDLTLWDKKKYTSKIHAELYYKNGSWYLRPHINSRNPTYLKKSKIPQGEGVLLNDGDSFSFADIEFVFSLI